MSDEDKDWLKGTPLRDLIKRIEELEHYQSLIMGKDIGMSGVWSRFSNLSDKIYRLEKNQDWYYKKIDFFKDEIALLKQEIEKLKNK